jgi:hypothetical protein
MIAQWRGAYNALTSTGGKDMPNIPASCTLAVQSAMVLCLCSCLPGAAQARQSAADACALFTPSQVSAVLGVTVSEGQHPIASTELLCGWAPAGGSQIDGKKLSVSLMTERAFEVGKKPMEGIAKTPLSGLGDDAYFTTAGGLGTALSVKTANYFIQIRVGGYPTGKAKELEKALAMQLIAKLSEPGDAALPGLAGSGVDNMGLAG